jgi:serine/threonine-protein kinase
VHGIVLVFELLIGESLVERLKRTGPIPFVELWGIVECIWMGLRDAHAVGVIHRDLKPSNVFLSPRGSELPVEVKILDFGISKLPREIINETLTRVGQSLGTFSFMPPEQIGKAKEVDERADIYSAATLIFQSMSGKLPYVARTAVQIMELKSRQEPRRLSEAMTFPIDDALDAFVEKCLRRDPADRFQTATEALEAWRVLRPTAAVSDLDVRAQIEAEPVSSGAPTQIVSAPRVQDPEFQTQVYIGPPARPTPLPEAAIVPAPATPAPATPAPARRAMGSTSDNLTTRIFQRPADSDWSLKLIAIYLLTALALMGVGFALMAGVMSYFHSG